MKEIHFINLTNGIEFIPELEKLGIDYSFVRIQSTTIERKNWIKLFRDLDHNLLMNLAMGNICYIYDMGTNRPYSKTIYIGVELIRYVLNRLWYDRNPDTIYRIGRNGQITSQNIQPYFESIYNTIFLYDSNKEKEAIKTKLKYYKRFLRHGCIDLTGISKSTIHDGDYQFYSNIIKTCQESKKPQEN